MTYNVFGETLNLAKLQLTGITTAQAAFCLHLLEHPFSYLSPTVWNRQCCNQSLSQLPTLS